MLHRHKFNQEADIVKLPDIDGNDNLKNRKYESNIEAKKRAGIIVSAR